MNSANDKPSLPQFFIRIIPRLIMFVVMLAISLPLWPVYWLAMLLWGRPPNTPYLAQAIRYFKLAWTVKPQNPSLPIFARIWLSLSFIQFYLSSPIPGLAWLLDELVYGKALDEIEIVKPVFVVSAGRSGSTQITRYIEQDENLATPNILQAMAPYLWLWKLAPKTIGRILTPDKVRQMVEQTMPPELMERHETDPFGSDTFDGPFLTAHYNRYALNLGPETAKVDFNFAKAAPHDKHIKETTFVNMVDRIARKTLLLAGKTPTGATPYFYLKGHFLFGAQALSEKFPDARFLTVIREPLSRLRSGINYLRVNPSDPVLGPTPWAWLAEAATFTEINYGEIEKEWFTQDDGVTRCVIRFADFVIDLEGSMRKVYKEIFNTETLPLNIPTEHPPRDRKNYSINHSLEELGVDEEAMRIEAKDYIEWCKSENK